MARQNTRRRTTRKPRKTRRKKRWLWILKLVLLAACAGLALIIAVGIPALKKELRRNGFFETEASRAPAGTSAPATPVAGNDREQPVDEVTPAERRELEALLK